MWVINHLFCLSPCVVNGDVGLAAGKEIVGASIMQLQGEDPLCADALASRFCAGLGGLRNQRQL